MDLEARDKRMVNPFGRCLPFEQKPFQLAALQRAGVPLPRTLITNFPDAVRAFRDDVGEVIYKPTAGGAETQVLDDEALKRLPAIASTPIIFQERVRGPDIRVTVVGERVVSAVEIPTTEVDYRKGERYRAGEQEYAAHALPPEAIALCLKVARTCHHQVSGIDLKQVGPERYVVLEANSAPVYLDIELKTGHPITEAIVDLLLSPH